MTVSITPSNGNLMAVAVQLTATDGINVINSISDGTNTYTQIDNHSSELFGQEVTFNTYYAKNITGGALTVTVAFTNANVDSAGIIVHEVSGADTTTPLDVNAVNPQSAPGTGTDALTSGAVTTTTAGQYVFGATMVFVNGTMATGTNYTTGETPTRMSSEYLIQGGAGSIAATFTASVGTQDFRTAIATFKAAAGGGRSTKNTRAFPLGMEVGMNHRGAL